MRYLVHLIIFLIFAGPASADEEYDPWSSVSEDVRKTCESVTSLTVPPQDLPDAATLQKLKENGCDPLSLYYGYEGDPDYVQARYCSLDGEGRSFGDYVLAMIYANGKGVKRNPDLALHFACGDWHAPAELAGDVAELMALKQNKLQKEFDMCDSITSGYMMGYCRAISMALEDKQNKVELVKLTSRWSQAEKTALKKLQEIGTGYIEQRIRSEVDLSGTARAAFMIDERARLERQMLDLLKESSTCHIQNFTSLQFKRADHDLNQLYQKLMGREFYPSACISAEGIKQTQRSWIKYRDAWVAFGHVKCPDVPEESWKTFLTQERIKELKKLYELSISKQELQEYNEK